VLNYLGANKQQRLARGKQAGKSAIELEHFAATKAAFSKARSGVRLRLSGRKPHVPVGSQHAASRATQPPTRPTTHHRHRLHDETPSKRPRVTNFLRFCTVSHRETMGHSGQSREYPQLIYLHERVPLGLIGQQWDPAKCPRRFHDRQRRQRHHPTPTSTSLPISCPSSRVRSQPWPGSTACTVKACMCPRRPGVLRLPMFFVSCPGREPATAGHADPLPERRSRVFDLSRSRCRLTGGGCGGSSPPSRTRFRHS
jgi:hypothetical protein